MIRILFHLLFLISILCKNNYLYSQNERVSFDINLWENGLPNSNGADKEPFDESRQNFKPSIRVFLPSKKDSKGKAIIAFPGGAYLGLAFKHEGYDWASYFNDMGIAFIVLKYRLPKWGNYEVPISDAEEAFRIVKRNTEKWNISPDDIGVMGFSAGGHLASTIATQNLSSKPSFQILFYPVVTMDLKLTHKDTRTSFLGTNTSSELEKLYSNEKQVNHNTPRAFIALSNDDSVVNPMNSINYYESLLQRGISCSLHIYPGGGHGWGFKNSFLYKSQLLEELSFWLKDEEYKKHKK